MNRISVSYNGKPCYEIVFHDRFAGLAGFIRDLGFAGRRIAIITDSTVIGLYEREIREELSQISDRVCTFSFPAGEDSKHLGTIEQIYGFLIGEHFDRHDLVIALGGGVTGDIAGFAAASYLRGVSFVQVPTTVLAQCDSSVGGKTGVDFSGYKNMVGAFKMPALVWINTQVLKTLDERQFIAGFGEVLKYGLIRDVSFFDWLIEHREKLLARDTELLSEMIRRCCEIKRDVVEQDPEEKGLRAILNFGHTIGHAVEKYLRFNRMHGECVALGMRAALDISCRRGLISRDDDERISKTIEDFGLPVRESGLDKDEILTLMRSDKKMDGDNISFILLDPPGNARIMRDVTADELLYGIEQICLS